MWTPEDGENITKCKDVTVFKEQHFWPINWRQWPLMFKVKYCQATGTGPGDWDWALGLGTREWGMGKWEMGNREYPYSQSQEMTV